MRIFAGNLQKAYAFSSSIVILSSKFSTVQLYGQGLTHTLKCVINKTEKNASV